MLRPAPHQIIGSDNGRIAKTIKGGSPSRDARILSRGKSVVLEAAMRPHAVGILQGRPLEGLNQAQQ